MNFTDDIRVTSLEQLLGARKYLGFGTLNIDLNQCRQNVHFCKFIEANARYRPCSLSRFW